MCESSVLEHQASCCRALSVESNVSVFAPAGSPRVPYDPVVFFVSASEIVPHEEHSVIQSKVKGAVEDSSSIELPEGSVDGHGDWLYVVGLLHRFSVSRLNALVACNLGDRSARVLLASFITSSVLVVILLADSVFPGVVESRLHETALATVAVVILSAAAVDELLL